MQEVLRSVRRNLRMTGRLWKRFSRGSDVSSQALVILATPSYAKWLEDDKFVPLVLESLIRPAEAASKSDKRAKTTSPKPEEPPFEIDVVCACVDGLAPRVEKISL